VRRTVLSPREHLLQLRYLFHGHPDNVLRVADRRSRFRVGQVISLTG
jgi:hypothetical protein